MDAVPFGDLDAARPVIVAAIQAMETQLRACRLQSWKLSMTEDAAQRRRWVKSRATTSASIAQSFARPVQVRDTHHSIHPREILTSARDKWSEIWRAVPTDEGTFDTILAGLTRPSHFDGEVGPC